MMHGQFSCEEDPVHLEEGTYYVVFPDSASDHAVDERRLLFHCETASAPAILWNYFRELSSKRDGIQLELPIRVLQWGPLVWPGSERLTRTQKALFVGPLPTGTLEAGAACTILVEGEKSLGLERDQLVCFVKEHDWPWDGDVSDHSKDSKAKSTASPKVRHHGVGNRP